MSAVDTSFYEKKKTQTFYGAVGLLLFVIFLTGGLYYYSQSLSKNVSNNELQLEQLQKSVVDIQQDEMVIIYSTYAKNKGIFDVMAAQSEIPSLISHLQKVFDIQNIDYKGFLYSQGVAQVDLSIETDSSEHAHTKLTKFLKNYRANTGAPFTVEQVLSLKGYDTMNFTAEFTLKK